MTSDPIGRTIAYYNERADAYAEQTCDLDMSATRKLLTDRLPAGGHILDAGCGSGRDSRAFLGAGFKVTAFDGSAPMAAVASRLLGKPVLVRCFSEIDFPPTFEGVYASASLLHLDDVLLHDALLRLFRCLKPSGHLFASFKLGAGFRTDAATGRVFNDMTAIRLTTFIAAAGGRVLSTHIDEDKMGRGNHWISVVAAHALQAHENPAASA